MNTNFLIRIFFVFLLAFFALPAVDIQGARPRPPLCSMADAGEYREDLEQLQALLHQKDAMRFHKKCTDINNKYRSITHMQTIESGGKSAHETLTKADLVVLEWQYYFSMQAPFFSEEDLDSGKIYCTEDLADMSSAAWNASCDMYEVEFRAGKLGVSPKKLRELYISYVQWVIGRLQSELPNARRYMDRRQRMLEEARRLCSEGKFEYQDDKDEQYLIAMRMQLPASLASRRVDGLERSIRENQERLARLLAEAHPKDGQRVQALLVQSGVKRENMRELLRMAIGENKETHRFFVGLPPEPKPASATKQPAKSGSPVGSAQEKSSKTPAKR